MGALKLFNGTSWLTIVSTGAIIASVAPSAPTLGQLWYDTTNQILKIWDGTSWDSATFSQNISQTMLLAGSGGIRTYVPATYTSPGISWSSPFTIRAVLQASLETTVVTMPPNGTVITGYGTAAGQTVAGGRIPLANQTTLYYDVPSGGSATTDNSRFKIAAGYAASTPRSWVPIAMRDDNYIESLTWGDGRSDSGWHYVGSTGEPAFQGAWVNYDSLTGRLVRFCRRDGITFLGGLAKSGSGVIFYLPAGYRTKDTGAGGNDMLLPVVANTAAGGVWTNGSDGAVTFGFGSNAWVDLSAIRFPAEQ